MTWQSVGTHSFVPTDKAVQVGSFDLAAGQDTIWVRITQLNPVDDWPWSYGILSWRNANGTPLGSIKAYSNRLGEVFRLGNGLPPSDGTGSIWFEPRGFNLGWLKAGFPWELQFEAQAGASDLTSGYWNRDPNAGVITPKTSGDNLDMTPGWIKAKNLILTDGAGAPVERDVPGYQVGVWDAKAKFTGVSDVRAENNFGAYYRVGEMVTLSARVAISDKGASTGALYIDGFPYDVNPDFVFGTSLQGYGCVSYLDGAPGYNFLPGAVVLASNIVVFYFMSSAQLGTGGITDQFSMRFSVTYNTNDTTWTPKPVTRDLPPLAQI